ncbi:hypothetical protein EMPG_14317 [Blastomyces silverae]|uniref:Uncharacterized protein n=1 Tax=Blastomyces silverae TaxID=2060906 RepID=A0A0H1BH08_9EURO|nr:hypothetical protein EMPG_14317 [Blastomyces silverae]
MKGMPFIHLNSTYSHPNSYARSRNFMSGLPRRTWGGRPGARWAPPMWWPKSVDYADVDKLSKESCIMVNAHIFFQPWYSRRGSRGSS